MKKVLVAGVIFLAGFGCNKRESSPVQNGAPANDAGSLVSQDPGVLSSEAHKKMINDFNKIATGSWFDCEQVGENSSTSYEVKFAPVSQDEGAENTKINTGSETVTFFSKPDCNKDPYHVTERNFNYIWTNTTTSVTADRSDVTYDINLRFENPRDGEVSSLFETLELTGPDKLTSTVTSFSYMKEGQESQTQDKGTRSYVFKHITPVPIYDAATSHALTDLKEEPQESSSFDP